MEKRVWASDRGPTGLTAVGLGENTQQMSLLKQLAQKKSVITKRWFDRVMESYPAETAKFLRSQNDPFANPVGQTTMQNLNSIVDHIVDDRDLPSAQSLIDPIIRIRAIQDFSPSNATRFIFDLKSVIRDILPVGHEGAKAIKEMGIIDNRIDELGLLAFDIYMQCREKIYDLKANEMKARTYSAFARAGLVKEPVGDA